MLSIQKNRTTMFPDYIDEERQYKSGNKSILMLWILIKGINKIIKGEHHLLSGSCIASDASTSI